jgi:hypothetical protein
MLKSKAPFLIILMNGMYGEYLDSLYCRDSHEHAH